MSLGLLADGGYFMRRIFVLTQHLRSLTQVLTCAALVLATSAAWAIWPSASAGKDGRDFDARPQANAELRIAPDADQLQALAALRRSVPAVAVTFDSFTGVARTVSSRTGYLTAAAPEAFAPGDVGLSFVRDHLSLFGLTAGDLVDLEVTDDVFTKPTGARHLYLRQTHEGLPVFNGQLHFNVNRDGRLISVNNALLGNLAGSVNTVEPSLSAAEAVAAAAASIGRTARKPRTLSSSQGALRETQLDATGISRDPIVASLVWVPVRRGEARLAWSFQLSTLDGESHFDFTVDAVTGAVWTRFDWVDDAQYKVYAIPIESPNHTTPAPPADVRTTEVDPQDLTASPFGWHDTDGAAGAEFTIHRGNNTHTWEDSDGNDTPPPAAAEPDCGAALDCSFPMDLSMAPSTYRPAAVASTFYWTNVIHDVLYQYGFDEVGGNFQVNNYGNGGVGNDDVRALAQASGDCNANFLTLPDGQRPRMRMFPCANVTPNRDGDFDHAVIAHEYGHGISNRLVGGPSNTSCLSNTQRPGEGWSDWYGLALTARTGDLGTDGRGIATYLFGQAPNGPGIRPQLYSTDPAVNTYTFESIDGLSVPHGVGSVWAQVIWEAYWALVAEHGFDQDIYNAAGGSGNQRAMLYVTEGLKNTACSPTFIDARDGVIQAAVDNFGGADVCILWETFAAYGLGTDSSTPGPGSTTATNGFALPVECIAEFSMAVPDTHEGVCAPTDASYTVDIGNNGSVEAVTLSVTGVPAGATSGLSVNPVTPVGSSVLTISNTGGAAPGSYPLAVSGTNSTGTIGIDLTLDVSNALPGVAAQTAPADGALGTPTAPTFGWTAATQGLSYFLEVASDSGFATVVYSATVAGTSHTAATNLDPDTEYFWRLTASNDCGTGSASATFSFRTANQLCFLANLAVPDNVPAGVTDTQVISTTGTLTDLDVEIRMTHTYIGDLRFSLRHVDTGTDVLLIDRPFSCSGNDIDAVLNDEAASPVDNGCVSGAVPTLSGPFIPEAALSAFDGEDLSGTWEMTVSDNAGVDTGTLDEWCLVSATELVVPPIFADGFESGTTSAWDVVQP